ncbi:hypothetical protein BU24DRAFT_433618 [Aaosphaeria arxii CBS 175.79]|uniref:MFS general substrate transporter n=1 Tax=Aaosphaeria arxii CBS 175.79 TaxID=1450172 RepID=A0A6A5XTW0_9PLEO|nr:uncharacterized protein BU24DRAFT_433618 [Aaosphaeria arxii CBS 175.79]KAF2016795.1 hypothetical protein BU24DRAFT_433618 [Aaosphaeria arxii CBS 175.79]
MCLAFPQNFPSFSAVRFLLAFAEGAVSPAFVLITSTWYVNTHSDIWVTCNGIAKIVGALMTYGIGLASMHMENWRVTFLICGGGTMLCGAIFLWLMPAGPSSAWFFTEQLRAIVDARLTADHISKDCSEFSKYQLHEAFTDSINARIWWAIGVCIPPLVGNICIMTLPFSARWGVLGLRLSSRRACRSFSAYGIHHPGNTKRSTVRRMYTKRITADIVSFVVLIITLFVHRMVLMRENKARDAEAENMDQRCEILTPTDKEDNSFGYSY